MQSLFNVSFNNGLADSASIKSLQSNNHSQSRLYSAAAKTASVAKSAINGLVSLFLLPFKMIGWAVSSIYNGLAKIASSVANCFSRAIPQSKPQNNDQAQSNPAATGSSNSAFGQNSQEIDNVESNANQVEDETESKTNAKTDRQQETASYSKKTPNIKFRKNSITRSQSENDLLQPSKKQPDLTQRSFDKEEISQVMKQSNKFLRSNSQSLIFETASVTSEPSQFREHSMSSTSSERDLNFDNFSYNGDVETESKE